MHSWLWLFISFKYSLKKVLGALVHFIQLLYLIEKSQDYNDLVLMT